MEISKFHFGTYIIKVGSFFKISFFSFSEDSRDMDYVNHTNLVFLDPLFSERNLNPKAACLKRREEEKTEELPGRVAMSGEDMSQQPGIPNKVSSTHLSNSANIFVY